MGWASAISTFSMVFFLDRNKSQGNLLITIQESIHILKGQV